jgi:multiple sugar transport system substrate-binding protein
MGRPIGQTLGHTFGDAPTFSYPYLWSWGGTEIEKDGKTVNINKKEVIDSVKFMTAFWKEAHDEGGLAWDDTNNNRAFLSQTICATLNGASIYIESLRNPDKYITEKGAQLKTDIQHAPLPKGPGRAIRHAHLLLARHSELLEESSRREGVAEVDPHKGELRAVVRLPEGFRDAADPRVGEAQIVGRGQGHGALQGRRPPRPDARLSSALIGKKAAEVLTKYIITDMYAKAVQGMSAEDAVKWAEGELTKVYT